MSTNCARAFRKLLLITWFSGLAASCIQRTDFYRCAQYDVVVRDNIAAYECVNYVERFGTCPSKETPTYNHKMNLQLLECCTDFDCPIGFKCCKEADYEQPYSLCKLPMFDYFNRKSWKVNEDNVEASGVSDDDYYDYSDENDVESGSTSLTDPSGSGHSIIDDEFSGEKSGSGSPPDLDISTEESGSTKIPTTIMQHLSEAITESDFEFDEDTSTGYRVSIEETQTEIITTTTDNFDDKNIISNSLEDYIENVKREGQEKDEDYVDPS